MKILKKEILERRLEETDKIVNVLDVTFKHKKEISRTLVKDEWDWFLKKNLNKIIKELRYKIFLHYKTRKWV